MLESLAPGFLIASPPLGDPNFDQTVVLLALHNDDGALGFVVNRPAPLTLGELLEQADYEGSFKDASQVWIGGPVQPQSGWVVTDDPELEGGDGIIAIGARLRVSSSRSAFDRIAEEVSSGDAAALVTGSAGAGSLGVGSPPRRMVMLGYSGWGPSQLEGEIARGAWLPTPLDEGILFDVDPEERWEAAYALLGLKPGHMMTMRNVGSA